jgi:hypothetical protein
MTFVVLSDIWKMALPLGFERTKALIRAGSNPKFRGLQKTLQR